MTVPIEVYQHTKPASRRRSLLVSALLLLGTTMLASRLTAERRPPPLGSRIELPEFHCSIQIPEGFEPTSDRSWEEWRIQTMGGAGTEWGQPELGVWHAQADHPADLSSLAIDILGAMGASRPGLLSGQTIVQRMDVRLGSVSAIELLDPEGGAVVRIQALPGGIILAVTFAADAPLPAWYPTFEQVCHSVKIAP